MPPKSFALLIALLLPLSGHAAVNDVFPADFVSLPVGTSTAGFYGISRKQSGPFQQGSKTLDGHIDSETVALRLTHVFDVGGIKVSPLAVLSWAHMDIDPPALKAALAPQSSGYGDLRLGATAWLLDDREAGHFLGINGILTAPTGTYRAAQSVNTGENRYRYTLAAGWIHPVIDRNLLLEVLPEVTWYGDNDEYLGNRRLEQKNSYALTTYLRYRLTQPWHVHLGWQGNRGGETRINGVDQNNAPGNRRWMIGSTWNVDRNNQLIFRLARDYRIDNGFKLESEAALRWLLMW